MESKNSSFLLYHISIICTAFLFFILRAVVTENYRVLQTLWSLRVAAAILVVVVAVIYLLSRFFRKLGFKWGFQPVGPDKYKPIEVIPPVEVEELGKAVDLSGYMPPVMDQGRQGSCVGWATGYYLRSYLENSRNGITDAMKDRQFKFSPSFVFNHIKANDRCDGAFLPDAFQVLTNKGAATFRTFPYREETCCMIPGSLALREAKRFKIKRWGRVDFKDPDNLKRFLQGGIPIVLGIKAPISLKLLKKNRVYKTSLRTSGDGHALVCVGFDDNKQAFKVVNSWGKTWADRGFGWIDYRTLTALCDEAYVALC